MGKTSPTSFSLMEEKNHMNKKIDCASMLTLLPIYTIVIRAQRTVINCACVRLGRFLRADIEEGFCRMSFPKH